MSINMNDANYESMQTTGDTLCNQAATLEEKLKSIETTVNQLAEAWKGSDATSYTNAITEQLVSMRQLKNAVNNAGVALNEAGKTYETFVKNHEVSQGE